MTTITMNNEKNGIEIRFDGKPESAVIAALKEYGFRWSGKQKMWYAKQSAERIAFAEGLGSFSSTVSNQTEKHEEYNLWDMTRTEGIKDNFALYRIYDTKEIASIIRKHLRARFPMCKWSVRSDHHSIDVSLMVSPFEKNSDEIKAIAHYAYKFAQSYNYDNSDSMTDYFDVNFYGVYESSIVGYDYEQREMTESEAEMVRKFQESKAEFEAAEEIRKQKEFEEYQKQREIEAAEAKKAAEIRKANVQTIEDNHEVKEVNYTIVNALLKANKDNNLDNTEYYDEKQMRESCQVSREAHFTAEVYALLERQLMSDYSFFTGMGGSRTDDRRIKSMTDYNMMSKEDRETVEWYNFDCVAVYCDGELKLIVDPQGYGYARYVYVADEQSEKVENYHSGYGISEEEHKANTEVAEIIANYADKIIEQYHLNDTWQNENFELFKQRMKDCILMYQIKFNAGVVRAITNEELKVAMYKVLTETESVAEQFKNANLEAGQKLTIFKINDFGMMSESRGTFDSFTVSDYAQYKNTVKFIFKPERKRNLHYRYIYGDVLVFNGWFELPEDVLYEVVNEGNGFICRKSRYLSCDRKQYDAILEYFNSKGIKPIINTYKPMF